MSTFSVTCFGTGDGWPCADRSHSSFLYRFGESRVLVDCGEGISRGYKSVGLSYDAVDGIALSHLHADHVGGFFMLMQGMWLEGRQGKLPVYLPADAVAPLRGMLDAATLFEEALKFRIELLPLATGQPSPVGDVRVTPYRTSHLDGFKARFAAKHPGDYNAFCFMLEGGGKRVGHSADLGKPQDLEPVLAGPLDLLVCEVAHYLPEELFAYLRGRDIKRAVFVHLARPFRQNFDQTRRLAAEMLGGIPHVFANDGDEINF